MADVACAPVLPSIHPVIPDEAEIVVLGGGVMGLAAAWQVAGRGHETLLLEPGEPDHFGSATRICRQVYADGGHVDLADEALRSWHELERETGTRLVTTTGGVDHGDPMITEELACSLSGECVPYEWLEPDEAAFCWPGRVFDGPVLYRRDRAGRIHTARAVAALGMAAIGHGTVLRYRVDVGRIEPKGRDRVELRTSEGLVRARRVVIAADSTVSEIHSPWAAGLLGKLVPLPSPRFVCEQAALFEPRPEYPIGPAFIHHIGRRHGWPGQVYGVESQDVRIEVGFRDVPVDSVAGSVPEQDAELMHALQEYVQTYLPGLDHERPEPRPCVYSDAPSSSFRVRADGPLIIGTGFCGQDFALAPAVGALLADLADGRVGVPA